MWCKRTLLAQLKTVSRAAARARHRRIPTDSRRPRQALHPWSCGWCGRNGRTGRCIPDNH